MRHEVLYQYDLPIEVLDDIPRTEEVLEVLYARSKDNYLVPLLFTRLRILWAYPETAVTYRLYEMNYADLVQVHVKFTVGLPTVMSIETIHAEKNIFNGIRNTGEEVRAALLTLKDVMMEKIGGEWKFLHRQNLLIDEYMVKESDDVLQSVPKLSGEELFEDKMMPGIGCYEPTEKLFDHFPPAAPDADDVFEDEPDSLVEEEKESKTSAMITRITRMVESTDPKKEDSSEPEIPLNDATVLESDSTVTDDQWKIENTGDAVILPGKKREKRGGKLSYIRRGEAEEEAKPVLEDDDSEVFVNEKPNPDVVDKEKAAAALISEELDKLPVPEIPEKKEEVLAAAETGETRKLTTPLPRSISLEPTIQEQKVLALSITLEPRDSMDDTIVDKCLEDLKFLRDQGVFTEAEYKERCLRLFKRTGL